MNSTSTGVEAFGKLSDSDQLKILGPAKYAAYKDGVINLSDLVGEKQDARWGSMRYEKSLREIGINDKEFLKKYTEIIDHQVLPMFESTRDDIHMVGIIGEHLSSLFRKLSGVRNIVVTDDVVEHYRKHRDEFDILKAESLLENAIRDPIFIFPDIKKNSVMFVDEFDERYYFLIPIKTLPGEMWLQTIYIAEKKRFMKRWEKKNALYRRK